MGTFKTTGNFYSTSANGKYTVSPKLLSTIKAAAGLSEYNVEVFAGMREGGAPNHQFGHAVDVFLVDPKTGQRLTNYAGAAYAGQGTWQQNFPIYEKFAQSVKVTMGQLYPGDPINGLLRWGGDFTPGRYSTVPDLMHFDITPGGHGLGGAGTIAGGLDPAWAKLWGVTSSRMDPAYASSVAMQLQGGVSAPVPAEAPDRGGVGVYVNGQKVVYLPPTLPELTMEQAGDGLAGSRPALGSWNNDYLGSSRYFDAGYNPVTGEVQLYDQPNSAGSPDDRSTADALQTFAAIRAAATVAGASAAISSTHAPGQVGEAPGAHSFVPQLPITDEVMMSGQHARPVPQINWGQTAGDFYAAFSMPAAKAPASAPASTNAPGQVGQVPTSTPATLAAVRSITAKATATAALATAPQGGGDVLMPSLHGPIMVYVPPLSSVPGNSDTNWGAEYSRESSRALFNPVVAGGATLTDGVTTRADGAISLPEHVANGSAPVYAPSPGWDPVTEAPISTRGNAPYTVTLPPKATVDNPGTVLGGASRNVPAGILQGLANGLRGLTDLIAPSNTPTPAPSSSSSSSHSSGDSYNTDTNWSAEYSRQSTIPAYQPPAVTTAASSLKAVTTIGSVPNWTWALATPETKSLEARTEAAAPPPLNTDYNWGDMYAQGNEVANDGITATGSAIPAVAGLGTMAGSAVITAPKAAAGPTYVRKLVYRPVTTTTYQQQDLPPAQQFVAEGTGQQLFPQQVQRFDAATNRFVTVTEYRPAATPNPTSAAGLSAVQRASADPAYVAAIDKGQSGYTPTGSNAWMPTKTISGEVLTHTGDGYSSYGSNGSLSSAGSN